MSLAGILLPYTRRCRHCPDGLWSLRGRFQPTSHAPLSSSRLRNAGLRRIGGRIAADRASGHGSIASQLTLLARMPSRHFHHNEQDKVRSLSTDLKAEAAALQSHHRGGAPRSPEVFTLAARHSTPPVASANDKCGFEDGRKTTTQSALSSKSCGMLSGTSRISFRTAPQFLNRSSSLVGSDALATSAKSGANAN